jgi:hypothetical protein
MKALSALLGLVTVCVLAACLQADATEGKKVTKAGKMVCGKCTLKICEKCTNVLQVKEGGKTVNYFLKDKGSKAAYHKAICPGGNDQQATVTGTLAVVDGKNWITPTKVDVKKAE